MTTILSRAAFVLFFALSFGVVPASASAATARPECLLIVSTPRGYTVYEGTKDIEIRSGERVILGWIGINASKGVDRDKKAIPTVGLSVLTASGSGTYSYTFSEGRRKATCSASLVLAGASTNVPSNVDPDGGEVSVSSIPLLTGGAASLGASVPVSYIKVYNPSTEPALINGFTLVQNGSADTDVVIGFATNDDKGGSRATIGGTEGTKLFTDAEAFVPLKAVIGAGKFSIFTIKAQLSRVASGDIGKSLMLDVASIDTGAKVHGAFPIRGTTWTLNF